MTEFKSHDAAPLWMSGDLGNLKADELEIRGAVLREKLSTLGEGQIEFVTTGNLQLEDTLGRTLTLHLATEGQDARTYLGTVVTVQRMGLVGRQTAYKAELRPWFWMLTRTRNSRVFQNINSQKIIEKLFGDLGFSNFKFKLSDPLPEREYCVQYRESDFDFASRLMEEEGLYYFFDHDKGDRSGPQLVITDGVSAHRASDENRELPFVGGAEGRARFSEYVSEFEAAETVVSDKVSLQDYDFLAPKPDRTVRQETSHSFTHSLTGYELYDYPGHYRQDGTRGQHLINVRMEAESARHKLSRGTANAKTLATGKMFTFDPEGDFAGRDYAGVEYMVTEATYYILSTTKMGEDISPTDPQSSALDFPEDMGGDLYKMEFGAIPSDIQYRAPLETPWPQIPGMHTAIVVGPKGEEIHTDKHGRIKVQFHWDREGKKDEKSSCWVRVMTPWSGKNWGMVAVPRIGQEIVVQFEEGDPDRPICTGMLYNADTMPPYKYPDDMTQSGIKTNSSKGGGGFNELMFEDKKDAELVRFQSQRDYKQIVKNNAEITVGMETKKDGNLDLTVHNDVTETIKEGNHTYLVEKGDVTETIETGDHSFSIDTGKQDITIEGNKTETIKTGNLTTNVDTGNHKTAVKTGNHSTEVKTGNLDVKVSLGKISMQAMQKIELKVGASTLTLEPAKITLKSPIVNIQGDGMVEVKSAMTQVKGDAMLILKGGLTMIN